MATYSRVTPTGWIQGDDTNSASRVTPSGWEQVTGVSGIYLYWTVAPEALASYTNDDAGAAKIVAGQDSAGTTLPITQYGSEFAEGQTSPLDAIPGATGLTLNTPYKLAWTFFDGTTYGGGGTVKVVISETFTTDVGPRLYWAVVPESLSDYTNDDAGAAKIKAGQDEAGTALTAGTFGSQLYTPGTGPTIDAVTPPTSQLTNGINYVIVGTLWDGTVYGGGLGEKVVRSDPFTTTSSSISLTTSGVTLSLSITSPDVIESIVVTAGATTNLTSISQPVVAKDQPKDLQIDNILAMSAIIEAQLGVLRAIAASTSTFDSTATFAGVILSGQNFPTLSNPQLFEISGNTARPRVTVTWA